MNKQIRELAEQAGLTLSVDQQVAFQRAAELIVKECINNYRQKHSEYIRTGRYIDEYEHSDNMLTQLGFKELFGVEL